jgi:hypothetical protein
MPIPVVCDESWSIKNYAVARYAKLSIGTSSPIIRIIDINKTYIVKHLRFDLGLPPLLIQGSLG